MSKKGRGPSGEGRVRLNSEISSAVTVMSEGISGLEGCPGMGAM